MSSGCVLSTEPPGPCGLCPGRRGLAVEHRPRPPPASRGARVGARDAKGLPGPALAAAERTPPSPPHPALHRGVHSAKLAVSPPLGPGFSPRPRLRPRPRPLPGAALGSPAPRRTAASAHPGPARFSWSLFLKSRKSISPNGRERCLASRGGGRPCCPHLRPPCTPRPRIDPASRVHRISPNGFADDSTSFSLKAAPRPPPPPLPARPAPPRARAPRSGPGGPRRRGSCARAGPPGCACSRR